MGPVQGSHATAKASPATIGPPVWARRMSSSGRHSRLSSGKEERGDEEHAHQGDHHARDLAQQRAVVVERLTEPGGGHAERHEHGGEREAEQQGGTKHLERALALLEVGEGDARDRGQVSGHERQHAGGDEGDEADGEGGEDRCVDGVGGDHSS